jgi:MoxR-like ATPase
VIDAALDDIRREVQPVLDPERLLAIKQTVGSIYMDDKIKDYVLDIVAATREPQDYKLKDLKPLIQCGASPRASINLCLAARANAFLNARGYVTPQDVKDIAFDVMRHRILLTYEAEAEETTADEVVRRVLETVPVP